MKKQLIGFIPSFFKALFNVSKGNVAVAKKVYLNFFRKEPEVTVYTVVSDGFFSDFFNALESKNLFSSKDEVKDFCEKKLPSWLRSEMITNLFFYKVDADKPATPDNIEVVIEDVRANHFVLRDRPIRESINEGIIWECDPDHKTFVLAL